MTVILLPPHRVYSVLGMELRVLCTLDLKYTEGLGLKEDSLGDKEGGHA